MFFQPPHSIVSIVLPDIETMDCWLKNILLKQNPIGIQKQNSTWLFLKSSKISYQ
jgi:hypothetical protein